MISDGPPVSLRSYSCPLNASTLLLAKCVYCFFFFLVPTPRHGRHVNNQSTRKPSCALMGLSLFFFSLHLQQNSGGALLRDASLYNARWCYTVNCPITVYSDGASLVQWRSIHHGVLYTVQQCSSVQRSITVHSQVMLPVCSVNDSTASGLTSTQQIKIKKAKIRSRLPFEENRVLPRTSLRKGSKREERKVCSLFLCVYGRSHLCGHFSGNGFKKIIWDSLPLKKKTKQT